MPSFAILIIFQFLPPIIMMIASFQQGLGPVSTSKFLLCCSCLLLVLALARGSLISSSEVQMCRRTSADFEPLHATGEACSKKFVVALAVRSGQGDSEKIYADIKFVNNKTASAVRKEQLKKPFRITVTKSDVHVHYPLRLLSSVNNQPFERYFSVTNFILGISACRDHHCQGLKGYCCYSSMAEKLSHAWEYKRGVARKVWHYFSHKYSQAICMDYDNLHYNVFEIGTPYLTYTINVTVQQLDYKKRIQEGKTAKEKNVWSTVGYAEIGPERMGQNTDANQVGKASVPMIKATWLGDFAMNTHLANFDSKYLLTPDWRASRNISAARKSQQVQGGREEWLIVDKHLVDVSGRTCNKIGVGFEAFYGQENRCHQKQQSCFQVTPRALWKQGKKLKNAGVPSHYFPSFYGEFLGPKHKEENNRRSNDSNFQLVYRSREIHKSLITLIFTADLVAFVDNRGQGRIVEALIEDFLAMAGSGLLTVVVQNTGTVTADFSLSIGQCTEGIIRVSERTKTINPREQKLFDYQISSSINEDFNHSCTVQLTDKDGNLLDSRTVNFTTQEGCVYCPAGQCTCNCKPNDEEVAQPDCKGKEFVNPFWEPKIIVVGPCHHCWLTDSLKNPFHAGFIVLVSLLSLGMVKMLVAHTCCRTKDGRPIDVIGVILGTTSMEHTRRKQRSATIQFLLGACFFVYLPLLPLMIIFCNWRRRRLARKRLMKKAERKRQRLLKKKQEAMAAMQGLMVTGLVGENTTICVDDALKAVKESEKAKADLPSMLVVSSSSDTDEQDFNYSTSSETEASDLLSPDEMEKLLPKQKSKKRKRRK